MRWFIIYLQGQASIVKVRQADRAAFLDSYRPHVISSGESLTEVLASPEWEFWLLLLAAKQQ